MINFDPNSLNSVFDKNFGAGSFNAGLSNAAKAGMLKQQAALAKTDFLKRLSAAQAKAKKDQEYMTKYGMTYDDYQAKKQQDQINKLQDKYQVLDNGLTSDQASKMRAKGDAQGRGGHQPSYDQQRKEAQQSNKTSNDLTTYDTSKMTPHNQELVAKLQAQQQAAQQTQQQQKKSSPGLLGSIGNALKGVGSEIGAAATAAEQFFNPFDKVSADQAVKNYLNRNQSQGFQEVARGANRAVDSASLGLMSNLDKKLNNRTPYYNSSRAIGQGGGTDMITSGLGYLVPGLGAAKAVKAAGLGAKAIPALEDGAGLAAKLARGSQVARTVAKEGALVGGSLPLAQMGINYAINPKDQNLKENLLNVGLGAGLGAVGDPILRGLGSAGGNVLAKFAKGDVPTFNGKASQSALDALAPKASKLDTTVPKGNSNALFDSLINAGKQPKNTKPASKDVSNSPLLMSLNPAKTAEKMNPVPKLTPTEQQYHDEFNQAVKQQVDYLKNSMGKGVDHGTTSNGLAGNFKVVNGRYAVSNNPKWYQDFYKQNGRKPNNSELEQLAKEHVLNGFQDEYGNIPGYTPKKIQDLNDQIDQVKTYLGEMQKSPSNSTKIYRVGRPDGNWWSESQDYVKQGFSRSRGFHAKDFNVKDAKILDLTHGDKPIEDLMTPEELKVYRGVGGENERRQVYQNVLNRNGYDAFKYLDEGGDGKASTTYFLANPTKDVKNPEAAAMENLLSALEHDKTAAEEEYKQFLMKLNLQQFGKNEAKANVSPAPKVKQQPKSEPKPVPNPLDAPYKPGEELPNTSGHIGTKTVKQPTSISHAVDKLKIKTVDNLHRLSQFDKQVEKVFGRDLKPSESTHMLGLNSRGSDQISKQILTQNMVDKNGEVVGKSLKEIASSVPKGKLSQFEDYLVNKHAITRMKRGEKVFPDEMKMTTGKSEEIVKRYEQANPEFKGLAKDIYNYNKQLGQKWLVDTGILSKDQWEGYLKENPHYVPNNRIFSDLEMPKFGNNAKKGFANQSNPVKKATGSQRQIVSPVESMIEHTAQYVKTAKRNEVMQTLINNIKQDPEAFKDWAEIVPTKDTPQNIMETLQKDGVDGVLEGLNKGFDQKPDLTKGNIVAGIIDGQKVHIRVHDVHLLDAITNLQPKAQNLVISALGQVTRVMKNLTTGINPVFSLTRNIFRDIPTAYVNSKSTNNPLTFSKDLVQSIVSIMKNDSLYKSFKAVGGGHSSPISSDVNLLAQSKRAILPQKGIKPLLGKGLGALENLNNAVESAPRLAEFKRLTGNTYDSKMKALYEANDVTVNFNKYGNWAKEVDSVVPYFNAAIQGLDKQWRVLASPSASKSEKMTALVKSFVGITIPTMVLYNVNHNDPNYQKVSNYVKDTNLLIPKGDGTFYKIPKPRELGVLFGSDVERTLRAWQDGDPKAFNDFATTIMDTFAPPVRTILAPFSDLRANKNFANAPIVPQDLQGLSPKYQYDSQTSEPAKAIGNLLNVSPKQIDYITKSYAGVLGELGIPATTKNTTIGQTLKQKVTVDPVFSNDLQRNFYDMKTQLDQAHSDYTKQGAANPSMNEALRKMMNTKSTQMSKVRKQMKAVQNDSSLTPEERLKRARMLQDQINQIAASVAR